MKKLFLAALLAVSVSALGCGAQGAGSTNRQNNKEMKTVHLTKADFEAKVSEISSGKWNYLGDKPAIIDFYATWCGPCKSIAPVLEELADEYDGKIHVYKVDVDQEQELAAAFGVRSVPSLLFVPMGETPQMATGALPKTTFIEIIDSVLLGNDKTE
jgi:thioredoxin